MAKKRKRDDQSNRFACTLNPLMKFKSPFLPSDDTFYSGYPNIFTATYRQYCDSTNTYHTQTFYIQTRGVEYLTI